MNNGIIKYLMEYINDLEALKSVKKYISVKSRRQSKDTDNSQYRRLVFAYANESANIANRRLPYHPKAYQKKMKEYYAIKALVAHIENEKSKFEGYILAGEFQLEIK